jgi:hypothetical protein
VDFDAWLRSQKGMLILAGCSQTPAPQLLFSTTVGRIGEEDLTVFLVRNSDLSHVVSNLIPNRGYLIDESRSPVVEFARCYFNGKLLRRGRLYYGTGYWDDASQWKAAPMAFSRWADAIIKKIRSSYKSKHSSFYVGPNAAKWAKESKGELAVL